MDLTGKVKSIAFSYQIVYDKFIIVLVDYRETIAVALQKTNILTIGFKMTRVILNLAIVRILVFSLLKPLYGE